MANALAPPNRVRDLRTVWVIAAGKAAPGMSEGALRCLGDRVAGGVVIAPPGLSPSSSVLENVIGGHPIPTTASEVAGRRALAFAEAARPDDTVLVLLSGGASALMAVPADGVTLADKQQTTSVLLKGGADIHALNTVRKHLSAVKGGRLGVAAAHATVRTLVISDVVGDDLSVIASGPTVADATTFDDVMEVLRRFGGEKAFPAAVVSRVQRGAAGRIAETPKPHDVRLARISAEVIGSRWNAMTGAGVAARSLGYEVVQIDDPVVGEARTAGPALVNLARSRVAARRGPVCVVSSGETTVRVTGKGRGGRNQELALAAIDRLGSFNRGVSMASVGTDGVDGPTTAAGAIVDSSSAIRAQRAGLSPSLFLEDNDAYACFDLLGDLIHTGPTGTNVGDLQVILLA